MRFRATLRIRNDHMIEARKKLGLSQTKLSIATGVPLNTVIGLEALRYINRNVVDHARALANFLDIQIDEVLPPELKGRSLPANIVSVKEIPSGTLLTMNVENMLPLPVPEEYDVTPEVKGAILHALDTLTLRERKVVTLRYGIDCEPQTYESIGKKLGVGIERIRQLESKALNKLKHPSRANKLSLVVENQSIHNVSCGRPNAWR